MEENLKKSLSSLFDAIASDNETNAKSVISQTADLLKAGKIDMTNPENFDVMFMFPLNNSVDELAKEFHTTPLYDQDKRKLNFLYTNYGFLSSHIRKLIESRCGSVCVADRSRHILNCYKRLLMEGSSTDEAFIEDNYWIPKFGIYHEWMDFVDSLYSLYYGNPKDYLEAYQALLKAEIRKYKHILHKWYLKWKDQKEYKFFETYDKEIDNPLNNTFYSTDEYYLVRKSVLPKNNYEIGHMPFMLKVPKSDVLEVKCISKEVYL